MANGTLKLKPSRTKWILIGLMFVGLAVGMGLMAVTSTAPIERDALILIGALVLLFVIGAVVSFLMLSPNFAYVLLTPTGFTIRTLLKRKEYRWREAEEFHAATLRGTPWVVFTLSREGKVNLPETSLRGLNKAVSGVDDNLPDTYGMSAEELAELMNQWKKRSTGAVQ